MKRWIFGVVLLAFAMPAAAQTECPPARPRTLLPAVLPVFGESPIWATAGAGPPAWDGPEKPLNVLWIRDLGVSGPAFISGQLQGKPATKPRFSTRGSTIGLREERYKLDGFGLKPARVTMDDLRKYSFFQIDVWFPVAGCYEMTGRIGRKQSVMHFKIAPRAGK